MDITGYSYTNEWEGYHDGDGHETLQGLGQTATETTSDSTPQWLKDLSSGLSTIGATAGQVYAAKEIARTGQVPTAQVNVGVAPETQKMLLYGGLAAVGLIALFMYSKR
jgi:hypothetical protein